MVNGIQLVQGLADLELKSAGLIKGQGQITQPERELLRRAGSAPQTLSKDELLKLMEVFDKSARYDIKHTFDRITVEAYLTEAVDVYIRGLIVSVS